MLQRLRGLRPAALPAAARAALVLERGERVISYAVGADGYVVATDRALHLPGGEPRIGWEHIEHAEWQRGGLHVRETAPFGEAPKEHAVRVTDSRTLPEVVRERVTSTIVVNQHAPLHGNLGVRVVGRRSPATDDVVWTLVFDSGLDPRDPELRARASQLLEEVRQQTGL